jgi:hypothetical protein
MYKANTKHATAICFFSLIPITEALWKIDNGPNCRQVRMPRIGRTRLINAHEQMNTSTMEARPSKVPTFVIFINFLFLPKALHSAIIFACTPADPLGPPPYIEHEGL